MKKIAVAVLLSGTTFIVFAQQQSTPIFRAGTTLVEFTIVATDQAGQPVTDLKQEDIAILQNGKPQPVAFFRFEGDALAPGGVEPPREQITPGLFTNRPEYSPGPARNVTAIVIDPSIPLRRSGGCQAQVMQYLGHLRRNPRRHLRPVLELRILLDFTADLTALRSSLTNSNSSTTCRRSRRRGCDLSRWKRNIDVLSINTSTTKRRGGAATPKAGEFEKVRGQSPEREHFRNSFRRDESIRRSHRSKRLAIISPASPAGRASSGSAAAFRSPRRAPSTGGSIPIRRRFAASPSALPRRASRCIPCRRLDCGSGFWIRRRRRLVPVKDRSRACTCAR